MIELECDGVMVMGVFGKYDGRVCGLYMVMREDESIMECMSTG